MPRLHVTSDQKPVPIIKIDSYSGTATQIPEQDLAASETVQLGQSTSTLAETNTPTDETNVAPFRRYQRAELLNVYTDISRQLFMTSTLSEGFWKQTQSLGILYPNSYFFRDLNNKLHGSPLI